MASSPGDVRLIIVPFNRRSPLKRQWKSIVEILTKQLKLMVCINTRVKKAKDEYLQKGFDFVSAYLSVFAFEDALAIVRIDGIYVKSFHISNVKQTLRVSDHLARPVGRICGANGRIRMCIENATRTRIVVVDQTIHLLGSNERI
ncbi:unnamed protein product, partial [Protopolystoma xenopodis]